MMELEEYYNLIETVVSVFTVENGILKVMLMRKKKDPYKGYWLLPGSMVRKDQTLEETIIDAIDDKLGLQDIFIEQGYTFSNLTRNHERRVIATSYVGFVDGLTLDLKRIPNLEVETTWFPVDDIPKMAYDHDEILRNNIASLKTKMENYRVLRYLFPREFSFPDFEHVYETIMNVELDRRNFRKKIMTLGILEETKEFSTTKNGRPARLYRFKNEIKDDSLY